MAGGVTSTIPEVTGPRDEPAPCAWIPPLRRALIRSPGWLQGAGQTGQRWVPGFILRMHWTVG